MFAIYTLLIKIYYVLVSIASFFGHKKATLWKDGRRSQLNTLKGLFTNKNESPKIWVHAASYGEFEMSKPLIKSLEEEIENSEIIISFFSPSGYEETKINKANQHKIYLPIDTPKSINAYLDVINPDAVIFIKYDFWFNFLKCLGQRNIPYFFTSLHMNKDHYLFNSSFNPFLDLLKQSKKIFTHNEIGLNILTQNGFTNAELFGDSRIDQILDWNEEKVLYWPEVKPVVVFGSLQQEEESMMSDFMATHQHYNYIIAPHSNDESTLGRISDSFNIPFTKYSTLSNEQIGSSILFVDTMGDLKSLYALGDIAYVGGGFAKGPHNIIEPLFHKLHVIIGPNVDKFPMAQKLNELGLLNIIQDKKEISDKVQRLLSIRNNLSELEKFKMMVHNFMAVNKSKIESLTAEIKALIT